VNRALFSLSLSALAFAIPAAAQQEVGSAPESSPYRDIEDPRSLSFYGGYFHAPEIPGNEQPHSAPLAGVRWDIHLAGPAYFEVRYARVFSDHEVVNPLLPPISRDLGLRTSPINLVDVGMALSLVGERTWHRLMPVINVNVGTATDFFAARDAGEFRFGTQLMMSLGGGIRYIPGGPLQFRVDVGDYFYPTHLPGSFRSTDGGNPVINTDQALTAWRQNLGVNAGFSIRAFR
jgi:hypothetical protein